MKEVVKEYIPLKDLVVYQHARRLSEIAWAVFTNMNYEGKKIIGDQFVRAIDSVGANIAEGYGRFYYLDKNRFYYNARASLMEAVDHWAELLLHRGFIDKDCFYEIKELSHVLQIKLNNMITAIKNSSNKK